MVLSLTKSQFEKHSLNKNELQTSSLFIVIKLTEYRLTVQPVGEIHESEAQNIFSRLGHPSIHNEKNFLQLLKVQVLVVIVLLFHQDHSMQI